MSKNPEYDCCRELVSKFCANANWPREMKMAKKLLFICPDLEAWQELTLAFPVTSLAFFLTDEGKIYIPESRRNPYLLDLDKLNPKKIDYSVS